MTLNSRLNLIILFICSVFVGLSSYGATSGNEGAPSYDSAIRELPSVVPASSSSSLKKARYILVDFWASYCEPCKESLPHYEQLKKNHPEIEVLFVSLDDNHKDAKNFAKKMNLASETVWDEKQKWMDFYKVEAVPTVFIFDLQKNNELVFSQRGFSEEKKKNLDKQIRSLTHGL